MLLLKYFGPVLAEEKPFLTLEQACQVQATDRHVDLKFICDFPFLLLPEHFTHG